MNRGQLGNGSQGSGVSAIRWRGEEFEVEYAHEELPRRKSGATVENGQEMEGRLGAGIVKPHTLVPGSGNRSRAFWTTQR